MPATTSIAPLDASGAADTPASTWLDTAIGWTTAVPGWIWAAALAGTFLATLIAFPALRRQAYKAGQRTADRANPTAKTPDPDAAEKTKQDRRDRQLLTAALGPAILFWLAVLVGSGRGLIGFAREDLNWHGGWEYLVPFTLDGVAISFGVLAFRAVAKGRNPDRAYRIVWMATIASAGINFLHEVGGSSLGAIYLAILSLFGMLIFHEFLAQFEEGAAWIKRQNPKFGMRWITWPSNTLCAWFAWRNYPTGDDIDATIAIAVRHLDDVRTAKRQVRAERVDTAPWWAPVLPWMRLGQLDAAISSLRTTNADQAARREADIAAMAAQLTAALVAIGDSRDDLTAVRTELTEMAARLDAVSAERDAVSAENEAVKAAHNAIKSELADVTAQAVKDRDDFTAKLAEASTVNLHRYRDERPATSPPRSRRASPLPTNRPAVSDETAVQIMLTVHRDPNHVWSQNSVRTLTGAGFPRIPRLIDLWHTAAVEQSGGEAPGEPMAVNQ